MDAVAEVQGERTRNTGPFDYEAHLPLRGMMLGLVRLGDTRQIAGYTLG